MTTTISMRVPEQDAQLIKSYAEAYGMTVTDLMLKTVLEKIEDEHDLQTLRKAMENPTPVYYSHEEVMKELGLTDV